MESELLHLKERLVVERRAQHQKPALGDGLGASWARMRQRVCSAEREARAARRMAVALLGVTLVAVTGVFAVALPWPAAMGSPRKHGDTSTPAGLAPDRHLVWAEEGSTPSLSFGLPEQAVMTPGDTGSGVSTLRPGTREVGDGVPKGAAERQGARTPTRPVEAPAVGRLATSGGGQPQRVVSRGEGQPQELPLQSQPSPALPPVAVPRSRVGRTAPGSRRMAHASVRRGSRTRGRKRRASRRMGRAVYWRVHRSSRAGAGAYRLMDPYGNWWEARRVRPRGMRRGEARR
jgi:hypothetical protein